LRTRFRTTPLRNASILLAILAGIACQIEIEGENRPRNCRLEGGVTGPALLQNAL